MDLFDQTDLEAIYTVSDINAEIKELLETSLPSIWVRGEISNFTHHSSGHMYFSLKDEYSQISCVLWKSRSIRIVPADGMKVHVFGKIRVYEKRGTIQIDVVKMLPAGVGDLQMAFEALKDRLNKEGLFDTEFKKPLPDMPTTVGVITSPTGAAINDIRHVISRRFPSVKILLCPAVVQGDQAPQSIVNGIQLMNEYGKADVLIVGRGGGSLEDLWAFNDERVARAIFASEIPVVSAVGHEIDFTISDFVADMRAPTPSAAAEIVVPEANNFLNSLQSYRTFLQQTLEANIRDNRQRLHAIKSGYGFRRPVDMIFQYRRQLDDLEQSIRYAVKNNIKMQGQRLELNKQRLASLSPHSILDRGYTITRLASTQELVKSINQVQPGEQLITLLPDGSVTSQAIDHNKKEN